MKAIGGTFVGICWRLSPFPGPVVKLYDLGQLIAALDCAWRETKNNFCGGEKSSKCQKPSTKLGGEPVCLFAPFCSSGKQKARKTRDKTRDK